MTVTLERVTEWDAKVLGHSQSIRVLQFFRFDNLKEDIIAEDLCSRGTIVDVQIIGCSCVFGCMYADSGSDKRNRRYARVE